MTDYDKPLPKPDALSTPYWEGARKHELRLQQCRSCGRRSVDPSRLCMQCGRDTLEWVQASGRGSIWSYGIFHKAYFPSFARDTPYNVVIVELEEGPRLYSNLVGIDNDDIRIGMPVRVHFEDVAETACLIKFRPA